VNGEWEIENPIPNIQQPASKFSIIHFQLSIKNFTFAAQSKLNHKMDDGPAKQNENNNLLSVGMSSLL
jgi:O-acetylhomoserine/O-acetylserine sulfhydrylase-like pyridoxal-dependent enzyme